ncbi:decarboxylase [Niveispirillum lacus]|uniref:ornithine decarboxylase n=1 Tax=Niveispirillum lacus TaxID=1981099 RepID=A0A255Z9U1_9PROT|nr:type III PLP-dependent enzyme [Niveispirillum lacus]OYQ37635.1 decarboxylase [Niveispirillum lacus]
MAQVRFRTAVAPLRRATARSTTPRLPSVDQMVVRLEPAEPMHCIRPATLRATAGRFIDLFGKATGGMGDVLYAVKCNPDPAFLRALYNGGIRHFDCASPAEIRVVRQMFADAQIHYMHPVKNRAAIAKAYNDYAVRDFSLDSVEELEKILAVTSNAPDLGLFIRLAMPKGKAAYDLSGKFGAQFDEAVTLLRRARTVGGRVGLCFHVGSQMLEPAAYGRALALAGQVMEAAGVAIDVLDVGGGFPVAYPDMDPPDLTLYMDEIAKGIAALNLPSSTRIWCEPGRALVAASGSVVVQVERRRGTDELFINDGVYGSLSDAGVPGFLFPCRLIRRSDAPLAPFSFWGPTCDSADRMKGPFLLPADVQEGDWIEIGQLGAYGATLRTEFNGFDQAHLVEVADGPLLETAGHGIALSVRAA